jgi:hypothetical protein
MEIIEFLESDRLKKVAIYEVKTLNKILGEDLFQSGKPAVRYIRRMELFLDLYDYTNPCASQPSEIPCPQDLRRLKRDIFPLLEVPGGQRFTLDIILQGSIELVHMNLVERILEVIRPAYLTLTRSGATVTINYVIFQVARISLDEFYNAPDDWRMRFQEELGKVGWRNLKKKFSFS